MRPDGKEVTFEYDPLGRRTAKIFDGTITRFLWDGNTPLHEWSYPLANRPQDVPDAIGRLHKDRDEPIENVVTWVFDEGTFRPTAKITETQALTIITDYLGTPVAMHDQYGFKEWSARLDIYGKVANFEGAKGFTVTSCPFRYQGQYEDAETGLYYNRFRYYSPEEGLYLSQDPIGLEGGNPTMYGYVQDVNSWVDVFGLIIVNPNDINYSQRTVSDIRIWDPQKYTKPIDVIVIDGQMVSYDNRRLLAAQNAGLTELDVNIVKGDEIMPGSKKTWSEAFEKRFNDPRNVKEGGAVPKKGLKDKPKLPTCP